MEYKNLNTLVFIKLSLRLENFTMKEEDIEIKFTEDGFPLIVLDPETIVFKNPLAKYRSFFEFMHGERNFKNINDFFDKLDKDEK